MHTIGIIGAMEEETTFLQEKMTIVQTQKAVGLDFFVGRYSGKNVILVKSGIGKVNAAICAQVLIDRFGVDCIINIGVAGAIYDQLKVGDIVISTDAVQHDMDTSVLGDPVGIIPRMEESYFPADPALRALAADCIKEFLQIHIDNPFIPIIRILDASPEGIMGTPSRPESETAVAEHRLIYP